MRSVLVATSLLAASALTDAAPSKPPEQQFEEGMVVRFHMHENYGVVRAIERLLLRGKLDDAKPLAVAIGEAPDEPGMAAFAKQSADVRRRALDLARAKNLDEAFRLESKLVLACASCHTASGVVPDLATAPPRPPDRDTLDARMARHLWAADRLWAGIVADSPGAWTDGIELLATGARTWPQLTPAQAPFARRMQATAETARHAKAPTTASRASTYGELLSICASCHTAK